jgi:hypothetical protein
MPLTVRLRIHTDTHEADHEPGYKAALHRLRARVWHDRSREDRLPLTIRIDDLQGRRYAEIEELAPLINVDLPAGTYHVTAERGAALRRYTIKLESGGGFDLYLRLTPSHGP